jgi:hypothetical protein
MIPISQLPNPPTDNLYKFLAITGIIVLVLAYLMPYILLKDLTTQMIEQIGEANLLQIELNIVEREVTRLENNEMPTADDVTRIRTMLDDIQRNDTKRKTKLMLIDDINQEFKVISKIANYAKSIGFFLTIIGFALWYEKLQRHQDTFVKREAEHTYKEIEKTKHLSRPIKHSAKRKSRLR